MVTIALSYYVVAYLLTPAAVFRWLASLFITLKNFQRTKTQEITFAVGTSLIPLALSLLIAQTPCVPHPISTTETAGRWNNYQAVYAGLVNEKASGTPEFWSAVEQVVRAQADFLLVLFYPLVVLEAAIFALAVYKYGTWREVWFYRFIARKLLLPHLSEWSMLLTPFNFPRKPKLEVWLDILTSDNVLYRGQLSQFFLDANAALTGIALLPSPSPLRFERDRYIKALNAYPYSTRPEEFWREIPSATFYIPSEKILNLNVTYVKERRAAATEASQIVQSQGLNFEIEAL